MPTPALWLALAGPVALAAVSLVRGSAREGDAGARRALAAAVFACVVALIAAAGVMTQGPLTTATIGLGGAGFALYLDALGAAMFALVSFVGAIVVGYSRNYLHGDREQGRFISRLCSTLAAVLLLIVSGNLLLFALAWIATSAGLHGLLVFYRERPAAVLAARKKFLASRLGDLCLLGAMALLYRLFGSLDYSAVFAGAEQLRTSGAVPLPLQAAAVLLVLAALFKSAQFPLHGWLIEVMETPTPVSALLHAGIINAGGFLVLRFADVIWLSGPALDTLTIVGGVTALYGSVVMLAQTSVKVALAYSTVAQMGFMMLECGLGAFAAASLHIVAHSLYKAHAFLSSGSVIDISRASWSPSPGGQPHPGRLAIAVAIVLAVTLVVGVLFDARPAEEPGAFVLGAILALGLVHLIANGIDERPNLYVIARSIALAGMVAVAYFSLQLGAETVLAGSIPAAGAGRGAFGLAVAAVVVLAFAALTIFQSQLARHAGEPGWQAMYAHVANGLYVNTLANRWVLKYWPPGTRTPAGTSRGARS